MQRTEKINDVGSTVAVITGSPEETRRLGELLGNEMRGGELIAIEGDLGSGKTVFVKGLALGLGIKDKDVSSPTFVFIHEYEGRLTLYHVDLYRIGRAGDIEDLGLFDFIAGKNIVAIEWADRASGLLPDNRIDVEMINLGEDRRKIILRAKEEAYEDRLKRGLALFLAKGRDNG